MKRLLLVLALGLVAPAAHAAPSNTIDQLVRLLNGTPTKVGTLVSAAGATISNAATSTPFTITAGQVYLVWCDLAVSFNAAGGTAVIAASNANASVPLVASEKFYWVANSTAISAIGSGAFNCAVYQMK